MPVLNTFVNHHDVTWLQQLGRIAFFLVPAFTGSNQQNLLAVVVDVPVVTTAAFKVNVCHVDVNIVIRYY